MSKTAKKIHVDVSPIHKIFVPAATDSRTEKIQQLKQAIYRYRNQVLFESCNIDTKLVL